MRLTLLAILVAGSLSFALSAKIPNVNREKGGDTSGPYWTEDGQQAVYVQMCGLNIQPGAHNKDAPSDPSTTPPVPIMSEKCPRSGYDDFFACNCHFVRMTGKPALTDDAGITDPDTLQSSVEGCAAQFGGYYGLFMACYRIADVHWKDFNRETARRGMRRFSRKCLEKPAP